MGSSPTQPLAPSVPFPSLSPASCGHSTRWSPGALSGLSQLFWSSSSVLGTARANPPALRKVLRSVKWKLGPSRAQLGVGKTDQPRRRHQSENLQTCSEAKLSMRCKDKCVAEKGGVCSLGLPWNSSSPRIPRACLGTGLLCSLRAKHSTCVEMECSAAG